MANIFGTFEPGDYIPPIGGAAPLFNPLAAPQLDLHLQFKFIVEMMGIPVFLIQDTTLPSYTIETEKKRLINYDIVFPKSVQWNSLSFTIAEIYEPYAFSTLSSGKTIINEYFYQYLLNSGHITPNQFGNAANNLSKTKMSDLADSPAGRITIKNLKPDGSTAFAWQLINPLIKSVNFGSNDRTESIMSIKIEMDYDWAYFSLDGKF
jgi:hypothetical protein